MKGTVFRVVFWVAILAAGYLLVDRLSAPPPIARMLQDGRREIVIPASRNGHYYIQGAVNGIPILFMIDTGATYVSVDAAFAARAGLPEGLPGYFNTANGSVEGRVVKGQTVRIDAFEVSGLSIAVMPARDEDGLLGQNFLRQFDVLQSGGSMRLRLRSESRE